MLRTNPDELETLQDSENDPAESSCWRVEHGYILTLGYNKEGVQGFFYYLGGHIAPYHAYLTYNETSSGAKYHIVFLDNETTGINQVVPQDIVQRDEWYDLSGRKLNGKPTKKGVYIHNGKAVVR